MDAFEQYIRGGLERLGVDVSDAEISVMRYVDELYGPELRALSESDLSQEWPEPDLDPSRAPRA